VVVAAAVAVVEAAAEEGAGDKREGTLNEGN
jgi:hypothetical protein